jgi:hypothetical protein
VANGTRTEHRLDAVRWPGAARRGAVGRTFAVAVLLLVAAGVLYTGGPAATCQARSARPGPSDPAATPAPREEGELAAGERAAGERAAGERAAGEPAAGDVGLQGRLELPAGTVGVAVTLADPAILGMLRPGDRVDVLAVASGGDTSTLAADALVVAAPGSLDPTGGALYLALTPERARRIIGQPATARFAVLARP